MNKNILFTLATVLALCACQNEEITNTTGGELLTDSHIQATTHGFDRCVYTEDELEEAGSPLNVTRSGLTYNGTDKRMDFTWSAGDKIVIFDDEPQSREKNYYEIKSGINQPTAAFSSKTFQLSQDYNYYAFTPGTDNVINGDSRKEEIRLDYSGQVQETNGSTDHLGAYNFMASYQQPTRDNSAQFDFKNLSSVMRVRVKVPKAGTYTKFEVLREDGQTIKYFRTIDLTAGGELGNNYTPISVPCGDDEGSHGFELGLGEKKEGGAETKGIEMPANGILEMYLILPATSELKDKKLLGKLTGEIASETRYFYITMAGFDQPGSSYTNYGKVATESTTLNISLRVNKLWQVGNTQTRAGIGDPGYDKDDLRKPRYLYLFTFKNGTIKQAWPFETSESDWDEDGNEWKYKTNLTFDLGTSDIESNVHFYGLASYYSISPETDGLSGIPETNVINGVYTFPTSETLIREFGTATLSDAQKQAFFKNIYVNDLKLNRTEFEESPARTITLYHNCAKVDVQWNNLTSTALSGNVTLGTVPTSNVSMFKPTLNDHSTVASNDPWSPSVPITTATCWNGRAVFYVPQLNKLNNQEYSITIGGRPTQTITFNAPTDITLPLSDYGKAAWLKANITLTNP